MEAKDQGKRLAIALALAQAQWRRLAQARDAVIQAEEALARAQKAEDEAQARLEKAQVEEKEKKVPDEWGFSPIIFWQFNRFSLFCSQILCLFSSNNKFASNSSTG